MSLNSLEILRLWHEPTSPVYIILLIQNFINPLPMYTQPRSQDFSLDGERAARALSTILVYTGGNFMYKMWFVYLFSDFFSFLVADTYWQVLVNSLVIASGVHLRCGAHDMTITLPKYLLRNLNGEFLRLQDPHCRAQENATHYSLTTKHTKCGTKSRHISHVRC